MTLGCDDSSNSSNRNNENFNLDTKKMAELKPGTGDKCFAYSYTEAHCADKKEDLEDPTKYRVEKAAPIVHKLDAQGKSQYTIKTLPVQFDPQGFKAYSQQNPNQPKDQLLIDYIKPQVFDFLQYISKGQINASGEIQEYEMNFEGQITPIQYVFDCKNDVNTIQIATGESQLKLTYKLIENDVIEATLEDTSPTAQAEQAHATKKFCKSINGSFKGVTEEEQKNDDLSSENKNKDNESLPDQEEDTTSVLSEEEKNKINETVENAKDKVIETEEDIKEGLDEAAKDTKEGLNEAAQETKENVEEVVNDTEEGLKEVGEDINEGINEVQENLDQNDEDVTGVIPNAAATPDDNNSNGPVTDATVEESPQNPTPSVERTLTEEEQLKQAEKKADAEAKQAENQTEMIKSRVSEAEEAANKAESEADSAEALARKAQNEAEKLKMEAERAKEREAQAKQAEADAKEAQAQATENESEKLEQEAEVADEIADEAQEERGFWDWLTGGLFN